jgi:pyridoxine/pyridoxamine 5'-phosphate oxidase
MTKAELCIFIAEHKLGVLGYLSPQGTPRSALVGIAVTPELEIVFDTVSSSRKYASLIANPAASFAIGWKGEVTVQIEGHAFQPSGADLERYQQAYFAAWPDGPDRLNWPGITYFVVRTKWIRYSDFDRRPPLIEEFVFQTP